MQGWQAGGPQRHQEEAPGAVHLVLELLELLNVWLIQN